MMNRPRRCWVNVIDGVPHEYEIEMTWSSLKFLRNCELKSTDFWALKDLTMSQAKKDYRQFLRDIPQNFEDANEAADAWDSYPNIE